MAQGYPPRRSAGRAAGGRRGQPDEPGRRGRAGRESRRTRSGGGNWMPSMTPRRGRAAVGGPGIHPTGPGGGQLRPPRGPDLGARARVASPEQDWPDKREDWPRDGDDWQPDGDDWPRNGEDRPRDGEDRPRDDRTDARPGRRAAARARKCRRRLLAAAGAVVVVVASGGGAVGHEDLAVPGPAAGGRRQPAGDDIPEGRVPHGPERLRRDQPGAARPVPAGQGRPGIAVGGQHHPEPVHLDPGHRPDFRVLTVSSQAYAPSLLATGDGSATFSAIDAYGQVLQGLQNPPKVEQAAQGPAGQRGRARPRRVHRAAGLPRRPMSPTRSPWWSGTATC